jgi:malonyl-CoA/methylmalonyl-CoA synthetase
MVITGGLNVYPKEVEALLNGRDGISESAVIGVPHPDFGEAVVAIVVSSGSVDEAALRESLKGELAGYKVPKRIVAVDALPRNSMGKVQKNLLRERFRDLGA